MREPESELSGSASLRADRDSLLLIVSACDENASRVAGPHVNLHS